METDTFMNIIAHKYDNIVSLFKSRLYKMNMQFDVDLFNDTFIKCATKFKDDKITYETTIKYFWTSYLNTIKTDIIKSDKFITDSLDEEIHDCIDNTYNELYDTDYAKDIYNVVMNAISVKYGEDEMTIYSLYKYHNWTEQDLILEGYDCTDLHNRIKKIHKFVKAYCKKHIIK